MVRVAICEDNADTREWLHREVKELRPKWEIASFGNGTSLKKVQERFHIFILDIQLGGENGYELAKTIRQSNKNAIIMFASSFQEYACEAFEIDAVRFLRKPFDKEKIYEAIEKASRLVREQEEYYSVRSNGGNVKIKLSQVCYAERKQRIVELQLISGRKLEIYTSIRELERELPVGLFSRTHQGYLVNLHFVKSIQDCLVQLETGEQIPLSRGRKDAFRNAYMDYCWTREEEVL